MLYNFNEDDDWPQCNYQLSSIHGELQTFDWSTKLCRTNNFNKKNELKRKKPRTWKKNAKRGWKKTMWSWKDEKEEEMRTYMNKTQMTSIDDEHANGEHRWLCGDHTKNNLPKFGYILDTNVIFTLCPSTLRTLPTMLSQGRGSFH